ncbi:hypothetical protein Tco_0273915 [Tanacetum coccineum]
MPSQILRISFQIRDINTNECMQAEKKIEEKLIKAGKLSQFIKELKQNDKPKAPKKGEASGKDKPLTILMIQPWERVAKPRITQSFSPETAMSFPPLGDEAHLHFRLAGTSWSSGLIHQPHWQLIGRAGDLRKNPSLGTQRHSGMLKFPVEGGTVTLQSSRVIPMECAMISGNLRSASLASKPCYWTRKINISNPPGPGKPSDMTGVPRIIAKHRLNIREGYSPVRQKKRGQAPERNREEEVIRDITETFKTLRQINMKLTKEMHLRECSRNVLRLQVKKPTGLEWSMSGKKRRSFLSLPSPDASRT